MNYDQALHTAKASKPKPRRWRLYFNTHHSRDEYDVSSLGMASSVLNSLVADMNKLGKQYYNAVLKTRLVGEKSWINWSCQSCGNGVQRCQCAQHTKEAAQ